MFKNLTIHSAGKIMRKKTLTGVGCHFLLQGLFLTQIEPTSSSLQADSFIPGPSGKPLYTASDNQKRCSHEEGIFNI